MAKLSSNLSNSERLKRELKTLSTALAFEHSRASHDIHLNSQNVADVEALCGVLSALSNGQSIIFRLLSSETDPNTIGQALSTLRVTLERQSTELWSKRFYRAAEGTVRILQCVQETQNRLSGLSGN